MKKIMAAALAALLWVGSAVAVENGTTLRDSLRSGGVVRTYLLYMPQGLAANAPVVVMLHGYGSRGGVKHDLNEAADRHGFAVCYPTGTRDQRGRSCWNVGYPFQQSMRTDDVRFMRDLLHHLTRRYSLSRTARFCTGMSNGGEMCYLLAYTAPDLFRAVAPVSGLTMEWLYKSGEAACAVPILEIHGTADTTSAWEGDLENRGGWGAYIAVPTAINFWVARNRCTRRTDIPVVSKSDRTVIAHRYTDCAAGKEVWLYEIRGGKHSWGDKDIDTGEELWSFFSKYLR